MKNIFLTIFALTLSVNTFAAEKTADKKEVLRTLHCKGTLESADKSKVELVATIKDTKSTFTEGKTTFVDYWSTLTFNDLRKAGAPELFGNVTSVETSGDVQKHRDAPRDGSWQGLTFYEIFKNEKDSENGMDNQGNNTRLGLIILSSTCTTEQNPKAKKCANPRGKRNYEVAVQFGEMDEKDTVVYAGKLECTLNSKGIAE